MTTDQLRFPLRSRGAGAARAAVAGARRDRLAAWSTRWWHVLALAAFVAVVADVLGGGFLSHVVDPAVHRAMAGVPHTPVDERAALVLDHLGQRWLDTPVVVLAALWAGWRQRSWSPLVMSLGTLFVMNLVIAAGKFTLDRGLAVNGDPSLFVPGGQAFPSGHGANAASAAALLVALAPRITGRAVRRSSALLAVVVPGSIMTVVSLYLGFHWFTDLVAGFLLGVLVVRAGTAVEARLHPWLLARRDRRRRPRIGLPPLGDVFVLDDVEPVARERELSGRR